MKINEKANQAFTELIVEKMKELSSNWKKPWISNIHGLQGQPQNINGGKYNGINSLALFLLCEARNYSMPVFLTWNQSQELDLRIEKGAKSFPVVYWNMMVVDKETGKNKISIDDYRDLSDEEKKKWNVIPYMKTFNVFNVDQTNLKIRKPELYNELLEKFNAKHTVKDISGMVSNPAIDKMIKDNLWYVPIYPKNQDKAYYSPSQEIIVVPTKEQFKDGESFYATLLHEMAHSTGHSSRLDRLKPAIFGSYDYGREELVAELSAAITSSAMGISSTIREENVQYLKGWLQNIREKPDFLFSVLSDANKASQMILDKSEQVELTIGKEEKDIINVLKTQVEANIGEVEFKINEKSDEKLDISMYDNNMIFLGDIKGYKAGDSWKLTTDTSIVLMVQQYKLDFINKQLHGAVLSEDGLQLREIQDKKKLSVERPQSVKIDKVQIWDDGKNNMLIKCNINGIPQLAEKLPKELYEDLALGKRSKVGLAMEVYKGTIDLSVNKENSLRR